MTTGAARLDHADAAELGDLLTFLSDWLDGTDTPHAGRLAAPLRRHYRLRPRRPTSRPGALTFVLGNDDGTHLFGHDKH